jgi:D-serine deaminase-like pyridoxal phosphate-dependent protein
MAERVSLEYGFPSVGGYGIDGVETLLTPALAIYLDIVRANVAATIRLLGGDPNRWRPHIKTAKLGSVMRVLIEQRVRNFKCSTTLEVLTACEAGAEDVLVAYPVVGPGVRRVLSIAGRFPSTRISALVENIEQIKAWAGSRVGLFVDINPGMDRTGIEQDRIDAIIGVARSIKDAGLEFRGLHYYDGHLSALQPAEREAVAHRGYDQLMKIAASLEGAGLTVGEVITAGTPAFPCTLSYPGFARPPFTHRASPGTVVYCDVASLSQLPAEHGYRPAALVLSTVVSRPTLDRVTCDAGHKTVSADAGVPTCAVLGHPGLIPLKPSEEHLPIALEAGAAAPAIGEVLYLLPRHVCPTVNNFDHALVVAAGRIAGVERVTARGREDPLVTTSKG